MRDEPLFLISNFDYISKHAPVKFFIHQASTAA
jgi:hypothetical protein